MTLDEKIDGFLNAVNELDDGIVVGYVLFPGIIKYFDNPKKVNKEKLMKLCKNKNLIGISASGFIGDENYMLSLNVFTGELIALDDSNNVLIFEKY